MNWVDFVISVVVLIFALEGFRRGVFVQLFDIVGFVVSLLSSLTFYPQAAQLLINLFNLPKIAANPAGFLLVWFVTETLFFTISSAIIKKLAISFANNRLNKILGFLPATVNALLFLSFALLFVVSLPIRPDIKKDVFDSKVGATLIGNAQILEKPFNSVFGPIAKQTLTFLTINPQETGTISLEFTQKQLSIDQESERKMFELVNQERIKFGVRPLIWSQNLANVGRSHSKNIC